MNRPRREIQAKSPNFIYQKQHFIKASNQRFLEESKHKSKRFLKYQVKYFFVHTNIFLYITLCTHEYFVHTTYATDFFFTYCTCFQHNVVHDKA